MAVGIIFGLVGLSLLILFVSIIYVIFLLAAYLIVRNYSGKLTIRLGAIILGYMALFLFVGWLVNYYFLPDKFDPMSILFNVCLLFFVIFLGWSFIRPNKIRIIITSFLLPVLVAFPLLSNKGLEDAPSINMKDKHSLALEELRTLPYLSWSSKKVEHNISGVVKYDRDKAYSGYNLYTDDAKNAYLMNMTGEIVYRWRFPPIKGKWEYFELLEKGEIVAICVGRCIVKLDRNSDIIWIKYIPTHHDIEVLPDGTFIVPIGKPPVIYNFRKVKFDAILRLSGNGEILDEWWTFANINKLKKSHSLTSLDSKPDADNVLKKICFLMINANNRLKGAKRYDRKNSQYENVSTRTSIIGKIDQYIWKNVIQNKSYDYYHLNTIEVLPETELGTKDKRFQTGNYLICLRNADLIIILDKNTKNIVWSWGPGLLDWPHMPTMIKNGNILIFDNGRHGTYSRVIEIDPTTGDIVWEYKADIPENFYSKWRGSNQRLPNGNTLICESEKGRVFEVTREREIVWEFYNPEIKNERRHLIYRMMRVSREKVNSWLKNLQ